MKNLELMKKISALSPIVPGALLAGCVLIALSGYSPVSVMASGDAASGNAFLSGDASGNASGDASGNAKASAISIAKASTKGKSKSSSASGASGSLASVSGMSVSDVEDGTYTGSGSGWAGDITVQVTVSGGKITAIDVLSQNETPEYWAKASSLISSIIGAQSTSVDDVSGATYSSRGIKSAVENALSKAKKGSSSSNSDSKDTDSKTSSQNKESFPYEDGLYEGEGEGYNDKIRLALAIQDKQIKAIIILSQDEDEQFFTKAKQILNTIVSDQTTDVDTVSGATYSSKGLIAAVNNALENAKNGKKMSSQTEDKNSGNGSNTNGGNSNHNTNGSDSNGGNNSGNNGGNGGNSSGGDDSDQTKYSFKDGSYSYDVTVVNDPAYTAPYYEDDSWATYNTTITVTIAEDTITGISFTEGGEGWSKNDRRYMNNAINGILANIPSLSGLEANGNGSYVDGIDTVSGATCSSITIKTAVDMALQEAAVKAN